MLVQPTDTFPRMSTPAISEAASLPLAIPSRPAPASGPRARPLSSTGKPLPLPRARPPGATPSGRSEVAAGLLLLVVWTLLWAFFLTAVVEPGSALRSAAEPGAARARLVRRRLADPPAVRAAPAPLATLGPTPAR
jgi:hypothetical protein